MQKKIDSSMILYYWTKHYNSQRTSKHRL